MCIEIHVGMNRPDEISPEHFIRMKSETIQNRDMHKRIKAFLQHQPKNTQFGIVIEHDIKVIGDNAFSNIGLTSVTIPNGRTKIENEAFRNCTNLQTIIGMENVTKIGDRAFSGCVRLTQILHLENVNTIGAGIFQGCHFRDNIIWCKGTRRVLVYAPVNNGTIVIPDTVNEIGAEAFEGCSGLISVQISNTITKIGAKAFKGCSQLNRVGQNLAEVQEGMIVIPPNVTDIDDNAFEGCTALTDLTIAPGNGVNDVKLGWFSFAGTGLRRARMDVGVTKIGDGAFNNCLKLETAGIPNTVNRIGWYTFAGCPKLQNVRIPANVYVGGGAFCQENLIPECRQIISDADRRVEMFSLSENDATPENFILNSMVEGIVRHYNDAGWLNQFYMWPMNRSKIERDRDQTVKTKFEEETVFYFSKLSENLINMGLPASDFDILRPFVERIVLWGSGSSQNEIDDFTKELILVNDTHRYNQLYHEYLTRKQLPANDSNFLSFLVERGGNKNENYRIAFWSKVLSAYRPGFYFIYDSRVAIALSYISLYLNLPVIWRIPGLHETKQDAKAFDRFQQTIRANREWYAKDMNAQDDLVDWVENGKDIATCYRLYLDLLGRLAGRDEVLQNYRHFDPPEINPNALVPSGFNMDDFPHIPTGQEIRDHYESVGLDENSAAKAHLEKMLFMMKKDIMDQYRD